MFSFFRRDDRRQRTQCDEEGKKSTPGEKERESRLLQPSQPSKPSQSSQSSQSSQPAQPAQSSQSPKAHISELTHQRACAEPTLDAGSSLPQSDIGCRRLLYDERDELVLKLQTDLRNLRYDTARVLTLQTEMSNIKAKIALVLALQTEITNTQDKIALVLALQTEITNTQDKIARAMVRLIDESITHMQTHQTDMQNIRSNIEGIQKALPRAAAPPPAEPTGFYERL